MPVRDWVIGWKTARLFLPAKDFIGVVGTAGLSNGVPVVAPAAGLSELGVVQVAVAADEIATAMPLPWNLARDKRVLGRVWFIHSGTVVGAPIFSIKTKFHSKAVVVENMDTTPDSTITLPAHSCSTTAESLEITNWEDLEWHKSLTKEDVMVGLLLACTSLGGIPTNKIELLGLELMWEVEATDIVRRKTRHEIERQPI